MPEEMMNTVEFKTSDYLPHGAHRLSTVADILGWRALHQPERLAYTFLIDGNVKGEQLTYSVLHKRARAISVLLQSLSAAGERALLLYKSDLEFISAFFGCLYSGVIAVPIPLPRAAQVSRTLARFHAIVKDAEPLIALSTSSILEDLEPMLAQSPDLKRLRWLATDQAPEDMTDEWPILDVNSDSLAYLQYTSGSTSEPKGVMVSHANVLHNCQSLDRDLEHTPDSIFVSWLPHFHDMGLIYGILQPLYNGLPSYLMEPLAFLKRPVRWLQAISLYKGTHSAGPNFSYDLCIRKVTTDERERLDLSSWRMAGNGSEPVRKQTLEEFAAAFQTCGFRPESFCPAYGLAEATLKVAATRVSQRPIFLTVQASELQHNRIREGSEVQREARTLVGCGRPLPDTKVVIADPESLTRCSPDETGEIWVSGPSVAQGYWGRPDDTEGTYCAYLGDSGEGPFLRTGDIGFLKDGVIFVTGRLKDLIIIRGRNLYPNDIEQTVEKCDPILRPGCGAVFSVEITGDERLVIVHEIENHRRHGTEVLNLTIERIRQVVAEAHDVEPYAVALIKPGGISKTTSGKTQRHACRDDFLKGNLNVLAQWEDTLAEEDDASTPSLANPPESEQDLRRWLVAKLAAKLGVDSSRIDIDKPITWYGLDSLAATELMHAVEVNLNISLPMASFLQGASIAEVATQATKLLKTSASSSVAKFAPLERTADFALSYGQRALWFVHQLALESAAYNIPVALRILAGLDVAALRRAFDKLVDRHASLRTTFTAAAGEPVQKIHERATACFRPEDASSWSEEDLKQFLLAESYRPFNLELGPLLRISLLTRSAREHVLLVVVHHIIADLWSLAILMQELGVLYEAEQVGAEASLPELSFQYSDYVRWQTHMLNGAEGERFRAYWQDQLSGELPALTLPTDRPRPPLQTYHGGSQGFELSAALTDKLKSLSREHSATLYMTLLSAFQVLLYRYTNQHDIIVGSPAWGRSHAETVGLVGYLVNPLVLRARINPSSSFEEFLFQTRQTVLSAFEHQDYPFPLLVELLHPVRDASRPSMFQVMFVFQKTPLSNDDVFASLAVGGMGVSGQLGSLPIESLALEQPAAQFDLTLMMAEVKGRLTGSLQYNTDLFDSATIRRIAEHFETLLEAIVVDPRQQIARLPILTTRELDQVVVEWNNTETDSLRPQSIHQLFEAQAARSPDAVAIIFENERLTYGELNRRANQLAHLLINMGVGPETRVGICLERSLAMVVGIWGILKAGGAYVPLEPSYPQERLDYMIEDSAPAVLLTQASLQDRFLSTNVPILRLDADLQLLRLYPTDNPPLHDVELTSEHLAYVIYTSGSTGKPKGVMIQHRNVVNFFRGMDDAVGCGPEDTLLAVTSISFDISVLELSWTLVRGARIILVADPFTSSAPPSDMDNRSALPDLSHNVLHPSVNPQPPIRNKSLAELAIEHQPTLMQCTPSLMRLLASSPDGFDPLRSLKVLMLGGEALPLALALEIKSALPCRLVNMYGPTETTIWSTTGDVDGDLISVGRPIANTELYILHSPYGEPVPVGVTGELYIGGAGVARGYLHRQLLTAERFIPSRFGSRPGSTCYRTGDLARYLPDGRVEVLGRNDFQVKIRGFRIELGEIEHQIARLEGVNAAVVMAREDDPGQKRLVAYVTSDPDAIESLSKAKLIDSLRNALQAQLPDYMVPSAFMVLDAFPVTPNGKVDRKALPPPDTAFVVDEYVAPSTPTEIALARIWADVLKVDPFSISASANFFDLGGHSLLATRMLSRVQEIFQIELPLHSIFQMTTVERLAQALIASEKKRGQTEMISQIFESVTNLSREEVRAMLESKSDRINA